MLTSKMASKQNVRPTSGLRMNALNRRHTYRDDSNLCICFETILFFIS